MQQEADIMALAKHANIVCFIAFESDNVNDNILVMELCGGTLQSSIGRNGLKRPDFLRLCKDLCSAICYLRQKDIIHRDIKPENVLYSNINDQIIYKLGDFGAARLLKSSERYDSVNGTFEYMHPDLFGAHYGLNTATSFVATHDLWSIGATLYHAATGKLPFCPKKGRVAFRIMYQMISEKEQTHISGSEIKNGQIKWSSTLPKNALGRAPKKNIESYLAGLLNVCIKINDNKMTLSLF